MNNYFAREVEIMDIAYVLDRISLECLHLIGTFTKLSCLNVHVPLVTIYV